jgi:hypothetical protein
VITERSSRSPPDLIPGFSDHRRKIPKRPSSDDDRSSLILHAAKRRVVLEVSSVRGSNHTDDRSRQEEAALESSEVNRMAKAPRRRADLPITAAADRAPKTRVDVTAITEHDIARRAYDLYLARGREPGHQLDDWLQAERELRSSSLATTV